MIYWCFTCEKEVADNGPYERGDGEHECQDCMESRMDRSDLELGEGF